MEVVLAGHCKYVRVLFARGCATTVVVVGKNTLCIFDGKRARADASRGGRFLRKERKETDWMVEQSGISGVCIIEWFEAVDNVTCAKMEANLFLLSRDVRAF